MRKPLFLTSLLTLFTSVASATVLFTDAGDITNFTITNTGTNASVTEVNPSDLDGTALLIDDRSGTGGIDTNGDRPIIVFQADAAFTPAVKVSFDLNIDTSAATGSNVLFRMGPDASAVGAKSNSSLGVQLTKSGTIAVETSGGTTNTSDAFDPTRVNLTFFYNTSDSALNLSGFSGPSSLAASTWALYVDSTPLVTGQAETNDLATSQGFAWFSGTSGASLMNFQLDNIEYSVVPEPATFGLLFGALALLLVMRRRINR
jgi:hypothetical protein